MLIAICPEPTVIGTEYHASKWRSVPVRRGSFWGYFCRDWVDAARLSLTQSGGSSASIDALRKVYSITTERPSRVCNLVSI